MEPTRLIEQNYDAHRERLVGFCLRMLGDRAQAEDLAQDVFVSVLSTSVHTFGEILIT